MTRIKPTNEAWKDCPRAEECDCNDCPLTIKKHISLPEDHLSKCGYGKTGRIRIGKKWNLQNKGMKPQELSSYNAWHNQPEEVKKARLDKLRGLSPINKLSKKGYMIAPKKRVVPEIHGETELKRPEIQSGAGEEDEN